jgi:hypothetical protein
MTRRAVTLGWCLLMIALGVAIVVRTLVHGGGALAIGLVIGVMFVIAGAGRFWTTRKGY